MHSHLSSIVRAATLVALSLPLISAGARAQKVVVQGGPPDGFLILEIAAMVVPDPAGDAARVEHVMDPAQRLAAYRDVDLAAGDRILAANGKRVRSASELEAAYAAVAVGQPVELGIERRGADGKSTDRRIVRFAKADPAAMPRPQVRMVRIEGGDDAEVDVMPALGGVIRQGHAAGSPVEVAAVLPEGEGRLREADRLISLDGKPVESLAAFGEQWDAIAVGAQVTLVLENGGERRTEQFVRQAAPQGRRVVVQ